jgi:effector-binding domain-containing protein
VELCEYINKHRLPSGKVMAFYYTYDMPYIVEAAIEVDSIPPAMDSAISYREIPGGDVLIAHYKGPYEKAAIAYHAIYKWLEDNHRAAREIPFEVYLNDPITIRNKNDLRTDIYQFIK